MAGTGQRTQFNCSVHLDAAFGAHGCITVRSAEMKGWL